MKKNKFIYTIALALSLGFISCSEDVLDTAPNNSLTIDAATASVANTEALLLGAYAKMRTANYYNGTFTALGDIMTGNTSITSINTGQYAFMYRYDFNSTTQDVDDLWNQGYFTLGNINPVIARLTDYNDVNDPNLSRKDQILGEAHLLRALVYFDLMRVYGDVYDSATASSDLGVPIAPTSLTPSVTPLPRNSAQEVFDLIRSDISTALNLMDGTNADTTRVNTNAANALLSRVALYQGDFNAAISAANAVTGSLITTQAAFTNFWLNSAGSELIWKIGVQPTDGANQFAWTYLFNPSGQLRQDYIPTQGLLASYEVGDYRRSVYYGPRTSQDGNSRETVIKYPDNPAILQSGVVEIMPLRYGEVILNRMEAYLSVNEAMALADLNTLRNARGLGNVTLSGTALRDAVREERRKELAFEGHYWHDLKRWNLPMTRVQEEACSGADCNLTIPAGDKFWLFPIPAEEISTNPSIASQQAPGYSS